MRSWQVRRRRAPRRRRRTDGPLAALVVVLMVAAPGGLGWIDTLPAFSGRRPAGASPVPQPGLHDLGGAIAGHPLRIGAAVALSSLSDPAYVDLLGQQFGVTTPTNHLKWEAVHPEPNRYDFTGGDATLAVAEANGLAMRGHTLAWYSQNPAWLTATTWTRPEAETLLRDHIHTVVGRYAGRIDEWDVVNEAFLGDGSLRPNVWLDSIGPDYLALAFRYAHEADPAARLYLNDFGAEGPNAKSDAILATAVALRDAGVPIHGVGFQFHVGYQSSDFVRSQWTTNLRRFSDAGFDVAVTELDAGIPLPATPAELDAQAATYVRVFEACLAVTRCDEIVAWGFTDRDSWIPHQYPGRGAACLYDDDLNPKPAHHAVRDLLSSLAASGLAPSIDGAVTGPGGVPAGGVVLSLVDTTTRSVVASTTASPTGRYLLPSLPPGNFRLRAFDPAGVRARTWWPAGPTFVEGDTIDLGHGQHRTVDVVMASFPSGTLAGRVVDGSSSPVAGRTVWVFSSDHGLVGGVRTGPDGWWALRGLPPGRYTASATAGAGSDAPTWYPDSPTANAAAWVDIGDTTGWATIVVRP